VGRFEIMSDPSHSPPVTEVRPARSRQRWTVVLRDAALVIVVASGVAIGANAVRRSGRLPLVATQAYEVMVPCPEYQGTVDSVAPAELRPDVKGQLVIDARPAEEHRRWHPTGALSLPFDYLEGPSKESVKRVLETRPQRIVVFGDGENPDSGEQLARQLAGQGIKNVFFLRGGAPALRQAGRAQ